MGGYAQKTWRLFSSQIAVAVLAVFFGAILARILGPEKLGIIAIIIVIPQYFEKFGSLALGTSATYYVSKKELDPLKVANVLLIFSCVIGSLPILFLSLYYEYYCAVFLKGQAVAFWYFVVILVTLPGSFITNYLTGIFTSNEDIGTINRLRWLSGIAPAVLSLSLLTLTRLDVGAVIVGNSAANVLSALYAIKRFKYHYGLFPKFSWSGSSFVSLLKYGLKIYLRVMINFIHYRIDLLIIMYYLSAPQVAFYKLAGNAAEKIWMLNVGNYLLIGRTASAVGSYAEELTLRLFRNTLWAMSGVAIILSIFCSLVIRIVYGEEFLPVALPLKLLLPGVVLMGASGSVSRYYIGKGFVDRTNYVFGASVIVNIVLNLLMVPRYGISGAAVATSLTYGLSSLVVILMFRANTKTPLRHFFVLDQTDLAKYRELWAAVYMSIIAKFTMLTSWTRK